MPQQPASHHQPGLFMSFESKASQIGAGKALRRIRPQATCLVVEDRIRRNNAGRRDLALFRPKLMNSSG